MSGVMRFFAIGLVIFGCPALLRAQREYGFDNTRASGQPYLKPEESLKRLKVPPGFEVKVFAAEPDIINPIAFTVDERGRLWVVECYEYPRRTPKGKKPRDRIKILEDTTGAGRADKVTVWAEWTSGRLPVGFDLASGIEVGHGGAYLGAPPYLFFLSDSNQTGKCDKQEILLQGFGSQDTHETLNTLQWAPDGKLYGLHGIFTHSRVNGVNMNAAVWRYDVARKQFDIFAEGTSNPWGMDFDSRGQCFLACCVIPHLFHMVPGGTYKRQASTSFNPYAYGLLNEISDHTHHKESGWAHAGLIVLEGDHVPAAYRGSLLMGSIHGCSIKRDTLRRNGSSFIGGHAPDFLVSGDKNFRPINLRWGPDGSIYVIDWHDQNPCHQARPDSWDMTHGRIYKIQRKGARAALPGDLAKKTSRELVTLLKNDNPWWYRTALRLLGERRDRSVVEPLRELFLNSKDETLSLRGLWGLYAIGAFDDAVAEQCLAHKSPWVRHWAIRLLGESGRVSSKILERFVALAATDEAAEVRLQLASTARGLKTRDTLPLLHNLIKHKSDAGDPCLPLMIWLAYEPRVLAHRDTVLNWLAENAEGNPLVVNLIFPNTFRRLMDGDRKEDLDACVAFLSRIKKSTLRRQALASMVNALQGKVKDLPAGWQEAFAALVKNGDSEVERLARRLSVNFQDVAALRRSLSLARDTTKSVDERLDAIRDVALVHPSEALPVLQALVTGDKTTEVRCEACRALAAYDHKDLPRTILAGWKRYPPELRIDAVSLLAGRKTWAGALLDAVGRKQVVRTDLNDNAILKILAFNDQRLNRQIEKVWGRFRKTPAELDALIEERRRSLYEGRASFERGRKVFEGQCAKCHKFEGKGHEVGPPLDGAGRDIEYLLVNILDPNRVVGQPYYVRRVELLSGRVETGLLFAEDDQSVTLKTENDVLKKILKKDIDGKIQVLQKSVMPEDIGKNIKPEEFRDLVRYLMAHPFMTKVWVAGPLPSKHAPVDPAEPRSGNHVSWTRPVVGPPGRIVLPPIGGEKEGVSYVTGEVTAPGALRTKLQLGSGTMVRAWLNGREVFQGLAGKVVGAPDQVSVDVTLREGVNRLLFRITYRGDKAVLYARLLDPGRKLRYPEPK
jgi:putative membrane-bound dehydrogenase-like protein